MRKVIVLFLLFIGSFVCAQENASSSSEVKLREVVKMVIFPGCESIDAKNKGELQTCMFQNIRLYLPYFMVDFQNKMEELGLRTAMVNVRFTVSKDGKITDVEAADELKGRLKKLAPYAVLAFENIGMVVGHIQPAEVEGGEKIPLRFKFPIRFNLTD